MMMDWLGERHQDDSATAVANLIHDAVAKLLNSGEVRTPDLGGADSTWTVGDTLVTTMEKLSNGAS